MYVFDQNLIRRARTIPFLNTVKKPMFYTLSIHHVRYHVNITHDVYWTLLTEKKAKPNTTTPKSNP